LKPETVEKVYARLLPTATENIEGRCAGPKAAAMIEIAYQRL
jgi:hypothetical protein